MRSGRQRAAAGEAPASTKWPASNYANLSRSMSIQTRHHKRESFGKFPKQSFARSVRRRRVACGAYFVNRRENAIRVFKSGQQARQSISGAVLSATRSLPNANLSSALFAATHSIRDLQINLGARSPDGRAEQAIDCIGEGGKGAPRLHPALGRFDGVQITIRNAVKIMSRKASSVTARAMAWFDMASSQAIGDPLRANAENRVRFQIIGSNPTKEKRRKRRRRA